MLGRTRPKWPRTLKRESIPVRGKRSSTRPTRQSVRSGPIASSTFPSGMAFSSERFRQALLLSSSRLVPALPKKGETQQ